MRRAVQTRYESAHASASFNQILILMTTIIILKTFQCPRLAGYIWSVRIFSQKMINLPSYHLTLALYEASYWMSLCRCWIYLIRAAFLPEDDLFALLSFNLCFIWSILLNVLVPLLDLFDLGAAFPPWRWFIWPAARPASIQLMICEINAPREEKQLQTVRIDISAFFFNLLQILNDRLVNFWG